MITALIFFRRVLIHVYNKICLNLSMLLLRTTEVFGKNAQQYDEFHILRNHHRSSEWKVKVNVEMIWRKWLESDVHRKAVSLQTKPTHTSLMTKLWLLIREFQRKKNRKKKIEKNTRKMIPKWIRLNKKKSKKIKSCFLIPIQNRVKRMQWIHVHFHLNEVKWTDLVNSSGD